MTRRSSAPPPADPTSDDRDDDAAAELLDDGLDLWAFDQESELESFVYRVEDYPDANGARRVRRAYVGIIEGRINPEVIRSAFGGGRYRVLIKRNGALARTRVITIDGEPRRPEVAPAPAAAVAAAPVPLLTAADVAAMIAEGQRALLAELRAATPPAPAQPPLTIRDVLELAEKLSITRPAADASVTSPAAMLKDAMGMVESVSGFVERKMSSGRTVGDALFEALPMISQTLGAWMDSRAQAARRAGPAPEVARTSAASPGDEESALLSTLASAIRRGRTPVDVAALLELTLEADVLERFVQAGAEQAAAYLRSRGGGLAEFADPSFPQFVGEVLAELAKDEPDDAEVETS